MSPEAGWRRRPGYMDEDLQPVTVSGPEHFAFTTDLPVRYVEVRDGDRVLGYLWAAVGEEAAGYEPRPAAGDDAMNAGVVWYRRLGEARTAGVDAAGVLAAVESDGTGGRPVRSTEREAPSLARLRELAGSS